VNQKTHPSAGEPGLAEKSAGRAREVAEVFLKLGFIGFGGPAAHIALMQQEVVERRKWVSNRQFLDLLGAANLIPGPSSTELAIFLGYVRAGWRGLALAGGLFILPAMLIVMALAWAYVRFGSTPVATGLLYGIKPVIIAIIVQALWGLTKTAVKSAWLAVVGILVMGLYLLGASPVILLFGGALVVLLLENVRRWREGGPELAVLALYGPTARSLAPLAAGVPFSLPTLFLTFLKVGSVVYGSGYVLLAFLQTDLVYRLGWLTNRQLIDAVAVGQFTPGPVFTTATFVGYLVGGWPGAIVATAAIFLPSFVFVAAIYPFVPRIRNSPWTRGFLDGASVAALGLMAAVTLQLAQAALVDPFTVALAIAAAMLLFRFKLNSAWLVLGGGLIGSARYFVRG
jgi:chromate transporter